MRVGKRFIYYEDTHGYIKAHYISKEILYVDELIVYPQYRKMGYGKQLCSLLPKGTKLLASPIPNEDGSIDNIDLVSFYLKCGFEATPDKYGNPYMVKK